MPFCSNVRTSLGEAGDLWPQAALIHVMSPSVYWYQTMNPLKSHASRITVQAGSSLWCTALRPHTQCSCKTPTLREEEHNSRSSFRLVLTLTWSPSIRPVINLHVSHWSSLQGGEKGRSSFLVEKSRSLAQTHTAVREGGTNQRRHEESR